MPVPDLILFATDFSAPAARAQALAVELARRARWRIRAIHCIPLNELERAESERLFPLVVPPSLGDVLERRQIVRAAAPELGVLEQAAQPGVRLIVMGTHGRSNLAHVLLGSVAERVVRLADCPVLTVRSPDHPAAASGAATSAGAPDMISIRTILCPVDFSESSHAGLEHAAEFAKRFDAALIVTHIVEPVMYPVAYGLPPVAPVAYEEGARGAATRALAALADGLVKRGVKARPFVDAGTASTRICDIAREHSVDLIVLATHGYTGMRHMLLGSTAEKVVRLAHCAVLTVKAPAAAKN